MVNPGAFHGVRKEFLMSEKASYYTAVRGWFAKDALATIERRFFKRFPVDLLLDAEPSSEQLAAVDDDAAEPELEEPKEDELSQEEYQEALKRLQTRRDLIVYRKGQIKRWMAYQYMKDHELNATESGAQNPFAILLQQLTGVSFHRPRQKTPANVWRRTNREQIEEEAKRRAAADEGATGQKKKLAPIRESVAKEMFAALSQQEKDEWAQLAKDEHAALLTKYKSEVNGPPSTESVDRQQCIQGLTHFVQPILDGICAVTGWKASLIAGGPEPAHGGRLNMISVHSGTTTGDVKMHFGRSEQVRYGKFLVPMYGDFLRKCYTPDDCRARAIPESEGFECLANLDMGGQNVNIDTISQPSTTKAPAAVDKGADESISSLQAQPANSHGPSPHDISTSRPECPPNPSSSMFPHKPDNQPSSAAAALTPPAVTPLTPSPASADPPFTHSTLSCVNPPLVGQSNTPVERPLSPLVSPAPSPTRSEHIPLPSPSPQTSVSRPTSSSLTNAVPLPPLQLLRNNDPSPPPPHAPDLAPQLNLPASQANGSDVEGPRRSRRHPASPTGPEPPVLIPAATGRPSKRRSKGEDISASPSKRPRGRAPPSGTHTPPINTAVTAVAVTAATASRPEWLSDSLKLFQSQELGEPWSQLLQAWLAIEAKGFPIKTLLSMSRPKAVGMWIQRARSSSFRPTIKDHKVYEREFNVWWKGLQPAWRIREGQLRRDVIEGNWGCLKMGGPNGLQSVVVALLYWGIAVRRKNASARRGWNSAVEECLRVFSQISA